MENIFLAIKFVLFYGMEVFVLVVIGVTLGLTVYQFARRQAGAITKGPFVQHKGPFPFDATRHKRS